MALFPLVKTAQKTVRKKANSIRELTIDEWLLVPLTTTETRDLMEIIERRHENTSTIFVSQFAPAGWHDHLGEVTIADAILDRIVHNSFKITIQGNDSMRKRKGLSI